MFAPAFCGFYAGLRSVREREAAFEPEKKLRVSASCGRSSPSVCVHAVLLPPATQGRHAAASCRGSCLSAATRRRMNRLRCISIPCTSARFAPHERGHVGVVGSGEGSRTCREDRDGAFLTGHFWGAQFEWTCLHLAAKGGHAPVVAQLLAAGADMDGIHWVRGGTFLVSSGLEPPAR